MSRRVPLIFTLAVLGAAAAAPHAGAATPATVFSPIATPNPESQPGGRWGERLVVANDYNGDGVKDVWTATPFADGQFVDQGRVFLLSGKDRSILRTIDSPEPQGGTAFGFTATSGAKFGFVISVPGDLNGDGKDDVVAGTESQNVYTGTKNGVANTAPCGAPEPNGCNELQGKAWAFSGTTSRVLHTFDNPDPQGAPGNPARFGSRIGSAGDVTGDRVSDIIIGASANDVPAGCGDPTPVPAGCFRNEGQAYIFNGATGALVRTLDLPPADRNGATSCGNAPTTACGNLGLAVQSPGDTNGDGLADQLVDAGNYTPAAGPTGVGRMYLFDGATGNVRLRIDDPEPQAGATFGFQDVTPNAPGDVNGDGTPDLYAHGFNQNGPAPANLRRQGRGWVFSGRDGRLIYAVDDPTPTEGGGFGFSLSRTDYNKDSTLDLYIGQAPHSGGDENGGAYVMDGRNGSLLKALELPEGDRQPPDPMRPFPFDGAGGDRGPSLGFSAAAPGDLNGDGEEDYLGGAPFFNEGSVSDNGRIYAFMSPGPVATPTATPPAVTPPAATPPVPPKTVVVPIKPPRVNVAGVTALVTPRTDRWAPYRFTVRGSVRRPAGISASACRPGRVAVQWKAGRRTISTRSISLRADCSYRLSVSFASRSRLGTSGRLSVQVKFLGNERFKPASARRLSTRVV